MKVFAVLTLQIPGWETATNAKVVTLDSAATRADIFEYMRQEIIRREGQKFARSCVLFFSAEPNVI